MRANKVFVLLCCLLSLAALYQLRVQHYETSLTDAPLLVLGSLAGMSLFIKAFFQALKSQSSTGSQRLFPLLFWLGCFGVLAAYDCWLNRLNYAPNFMHVSSGSDYSIDGFTLRKNGHYIYWNGSGLGESRSYGTYIQKDSLISLRPSSEHNAPRQTRLAIRPYSSTSFPAFGPSSRLYLLDSHGAIARFDSGYRIVELDAH